MLVGEHKELPEGRIIAVNNEAGYQAKTLPPGIYFWYWLWQYEVTLQSFIVIPEGKIGLLVAKDGKELETGRILARRVACDGFQDAEAFIRNGGRKGRQTAYITAGTYRINTFLFDVIISELTKIEDNMVGIVTTLDGLPVTKAAPTEPSAACWD